ncbi:Gfo/Idh/MocA family oxidoreductase [Mesorhizobium sp. 1M-11]|uniref:Gfo/Idh/MocA family protein n=1 Tax=Mesorhizobium sp. 1M-11 TaxID=1529006 RepID=UPI0009EC42CA|nr:Gfo/Idh/MocA family oxidoreductase [Mesorhizobium sp. 1M-11]
MERIGVGVIGTGDISSIYLRNLNLFAGVRVVACAGRNRDAAVRRAAQFGIEALDVDQLLKRDDIGIVVNLTPPASHADVTRDALSADKHVFSEKPLAVEAATGRALVAEARSRSLLLGCAPDTFLGAGGRLARGVIDAGEIGTVTSGVCMFLSSGMEHRHPNPEFFFKAGGGPVLDIGPYYLTTLVNLLGPVASVQAEASTGFRERLVTAAGPQQGRRILVETPTTIMALLKFRSGAIVNAMFSWDVRLHGRQSIEIHGNAGTMLVPDPDTYGGSVSIGMDGGAWDVRGSDTAPLGRPNWSPSGDPSQQFANYRGLGVAEMSSAILLGKPHRSSGVLASHVLDVMESILVAAGERRTVDIDSCPRRPEVLSEDDALELTKLKLRPSTMLAAHAGVDQPSN